MSANSRTVRALVGVVALGAIAISGCSSDAKSDPATTPVAAETTLPAAVTSIAAVTSAPAETTADTTAASAPAAGGAALTIKGFTFSTLTAAVGEPITITNEDTAPHTVTADDGSFSVDVPAGGTAELTIPAAGTFAIHCSIHSSMVGSITVG